MQKTNNKESPIKEFILKSVCDPVVWYTVLIISSIMYHYRSELTWAYALGTFAAAALIYRLFDFIAKHKLIGAAAYIALFMAFMYVSGSFIEMGRENYPISFLLWFLTPQDSLQYNGEYTIAIYLLFLIFMLSVIYYFTKVRYRIFMNFLIFIIPFALYGKEYEKMPISFIMLLAIGYIVIMINCRRITEDEKTIIIGRGRLWKSAAVYVIIYASFAATVPKPVIEADRSMLEQMIQADAFTDRLNEALGVFRDMSGGDNLRRTSDQSIHYYALAEEDLRLKTTTFSTYNYSDDTWAIEDDDTRFRETTENGSLTQAETDDIIEAVALAAAEDKDFAEKYGLENFTADTLTPVELKEIRIHTAFVGTAFAPVPTSMTEMTSTDYNGKMALIKSGLIYCVKNTFRANQIFTFEYSSERFFYDGGNLELLSIFSRDDYYDMIFDASIVLEDIDEEASDMLVESFLDVRYNDLYLDYGSSDKIKALAEEITAGLSSDYEKAKAIENYFEENKFYYDLEYVKSKGDNAETFLFESKRGVCYEFATSMVLLARAAGIPARYAEGYSMTERYSIERFGTNYLIRARAAHGFPELYIRGAGWVSFEPTVSTNAPADARNNTTGRLASAGIYLLAASLIFLFIVKIMPKVLHIIFIKRVRKMKPEAAAAAIMRRIYSIYKTESTKTVREAAEEIKRKSGADITYAAELFERVAYGGKKITDSEKEKALQVYIRAYDALNEQKNKKKSKNWAKA